MKHAQSRHIVKFIESFAFETDLCIVMEYYSGGNLRKQMEALKKMAFKERKRRCYKPFYQMLSALAYLHSLGIVHCDLKPENVFFDTEGNVKTGDYGLTKQIVIFKLHSEAHISNKMPYASDIWILGVIMIVHSEMITGFNPFEGRSLAETIGNITRGKMADLPYYIKGQLRKMLLSMVDMQQRNRPTAVKLLDTDLMYFYSEIEKAGDRKEGLGEKEVNLQTNNKIGELEGNIRMLKAENEKEKQEKDKEKKRADLIQYKKNKSEQEIDNILTFVAQKEEQSEITEFDWIEIKEILEVEEKGSEEQKKKIRQIEDYDIYEDNICIQWIKWRRIEKEND
ncbi:MAG: putative CBL-interacting serine/threonine-protein kinase 21 [Streblomastix strix]|uniref:Putative CBL-interacting serine/threonine-protein kinase 21 n=1 Tax=Streblomastix strix TaxID=222440 RepID=A0A5J4WS12_9EUKA|nr:MAG: putative CBL-interacting serine/threonine-protein kinase 21 [Streblomastix strix]